MYRILRRPWWRPDQERVLLPSPLYSASDPLAAYPDAAERGPGDWGFIDFRWLVHGDRGMLEQRGCQCHVVGEERNQKQCHVHHGCSRKEWWYPRGRMLRHGVSRLRPAIPECVSSIGDAVVYGMHSSGMQAR